MIQGGESVEVVINDPIAMQVFIDAGATQFNVMLFIIVVVLGSAYLFYQFFLMPYLRKKHLEVKGVDLPTTEKIKWAFRVAFYLWDSFTWESSHQGVYFLVGDLEWTLGVTSLDYKFNEKGSWMDNRYM